eukprot:TRINITY_DN2368_c1_g1_i1.p1 TRINITY_DN2368_c1_g1~~TRINITY_DN2368_c1_g1_i1.p1  ORF type:complete len:1652 (+),score=446.98 TRINITY_DN2368_c1_g1_i1:77-5032(+)
MPERRRVPRAAVLLWCVWLSHHAAAGSANADSNSRLGAALRAMVAKQRAARAAAAAEGSGRRAEAAQEQEQWTHPSQGQCNVLGSIPLPDCPGVPCAALESMGVSLVAGQPYKQEDIDTACGEIPLCMVPFFANAIVAGAAGGETHVEFCARATKCKVLGMVDVPECPKAECEALNTLSAAITSGQPQDPALIHFVCSETVRCMDPFFGTPLVQQVLPTTTADYCSSPAEPFTCSVLGMVTLEVCPSKHCQAINRIAMALAASPPAVPAFADVKVMCSERERCAEPLWANPLVKGLTGGLTVNYWCGTPAPSAEERERPNCTALPETGRLGSGAPAGRCSAEQQTTQLRCCDDPEGELAAVETDCNDVATDVTVHCYQNINARLWDIFKCPVERADEAQRQVRELCPRRCQYTPRPGCECPKSYDKGCPDLQCLVPDEDKYKWDVECSHCEVYGAILKCTEPGQAFKDVLRIVLYIVLGLDLLGVVIYVVRHKTKVKARPSIMVRRHSSAIEVLQRRLSDTYIGAQASNVIGCLWVAFERYRIAFEKKCYRFGWFLASHRAPMLTAMIVCMFFIAACGLPQAEIDTSPSSTDWAPSGGRLERQLEYYNKWLNPAGTFTWFFVMIGPDDPSESVLQRKYLDVLWRVLRAMLGVSVPVRRADGNGTIQVSFEDFCLRIPENPTFDAIYPGEKPCITASALDCFFEGAYQIENTTMHRWPDQVTEATRNLEVAVTILNNLFGSTGSVVDSYRGRPSFMNLTDAEIVRRLSDWPLESGGCYNWATGYTMMRLFGVGGIVEEPQPKCPPELNRGGPAPLMKHARMFSAIVSQASVEAAQQFRSRLSDVQAPDLLQARRNWEDAIENFLERVSGDEVNYPGVRATVIFSTFQGDVIKELANTQVVMLIIGYCIMSVVIAWEINCTVPVDNLAPVAAVYFFFIMLISTGAAFGLVAVIGLPYNYLMMQVLPFLAIGLGVDDMFLLLHYFRAVPNKSRKTHEVIADLMHGGGRSVTLTSLTNMMTFFGGALVPIPALRTYLLLGGLIVVFNYISSVICLPLMLAYWTDHHRSTTMWHEQVNAGKPPQPSGGLQGVVENKFSPFMQKRPVQVVFVLVWLVLVVFFSLSLIFIAPITVDFDLTDLAAKGTYLAESVSDFQDLFYVQMYRHGWMVELGDGTGQGPYGAGLNIADPAVQQKLQTTAFRLGTQVPSVLDETPNHWIYRLYEYIESVNASHVHKERYDTRQPSRTNCDPECLALTNSTNEDLAAFQRCNATGQCGLYRDGDPWWTDPEPFWRYFHNWRHPIDGGIDSLSAFALGALGWGYSHGTERYNPLPGCTEPGCNDTNILTLTYTSYNADTRCFDSPGDWKDHTNVLRSAVSEELGEYAYPYPTDAYFDVELFETTQHFFWQTLGIAVAGVFVSAVVVPVSIKGAALIALSGFAATIELTGLLMLAGISFTTTIAVSIIMAIGLSVDPVVHCVSAYEHCTEPGRNHRVHHAVAYSTIPIVKSGISTIISFIMMSTSPYPYVFKYSFLPLLVSIIISMVHGIFFIPAILGVLGSDVELDPIVSPAVETHNGSAETTEGAPQVLTVKPLDGDTPNNPLQVPAASGNEEKELVVSPKQHDRQEQLDAVQKKVEQKKERRRSQPTKDSEATVQTS